MPVRITDIRVNAGTAVTVFFHFEKPTRTTYPNVQSVVAVPLAVQVIWQWTGQPTPTTYTYTPTGGEITKLAGSTAFVCTISSRTAPSDTLTGRVTGAGGGVTATAPFEIVLDPIGP